MLDVSITLDSRPTDSYVRTGSGIKGNLSDAIYAIEQCMTIINMVASHERGDRSDNSVYIEGTTNLNVGEFMAALYTNENIQSRIKRIKTNYDVLKLSNTPQQHLPTEDEIITQRKSRAFANTTECNGGIGCDLDICPVHGT